MYHLGNVSDFSLLDVRCFEALNQKGPPTLSKEVTSAVMKERGRIICKYTNISTKVPYVHKSDNAILWLEKYPLFCIPFHTPITQYHTIMYLVWFIFSKPSKCTTSWKFFFFFVVKTFFDSFRWYNQIQFQERKCIVGYCLVFKSNYKKCKMLPTFQNSCNICLGALWNLHSKNIANTGFRKHKSFIASIPKLLSQIWAPQKGSDTVNFLHVHFHEDTKGKRSFT